MLLLIQDVTHLQSTDFITEASKFLQWICVWIVYWKGNFKKYY